MIKQNSSQLFVFSLGSFLGFTLSTSNVYAAIIWDYSPETTGTTSGQSSLSNTSDRQNFAEIVSFTNPVQLTGIDIYSARFNGSVGDSVTIRIWSDNAGTPDMLIHNFTDIISVIDTEGVGSWSGFGVPNRKFVDFSSSPVSLDAGTSYWIGMPGTTPIDISQAFLNTNPGDGASAQFSGTSFSSFPSFGDMAFRLHGEVQNSETTFEPNSGVGLLGLGILGVCSLIKTQKKS